MYNTKKETKNQKPDKLFTNTILRRLFLKRNQIRRNDFHSKKNVQLKNH